jgi:hypothetical protein
MHAGFQELLSLRDGEPVGAGVGQHVASCAYCKRELGRLTRLKSELRQLPDFEPPPGNWWAVRGELALPAIRPQRSNWLPLSAAAAIIFVVALTFLWSLHRDRGEVVEGSNIAGSDVDRKDMIGLLVTRSQLLEGILQGLPRRPTVERAATSATIDELQTRIQLLDFQLSTVATSDSDQDRAQRLWSTRVQLLSSLVSVRYAEAVRDGEASVNPLASGVI